MAQRKVKLSNAKASQTRMLKNLARALVFLNGRARTRHELAVHLGITPLTALRYLEAWIGLKFVTYVDHQRPLPFTYTALVRLAPALKVVHRKL